MKIMSSFLFLSTVVIMFIQKYRCLFEKHNPFFRKLLFGIHKHFLSLKISVKQIINSKFTQITEKYCKNWFQLLIYYFCFGRKFTTVFDITIVMVLFCRLPNLYDSFLHLIRLLKYIPTSEFFQVHLIDNKRWRWLTILKINLYKNFKKYGKKIQFANGHTFTV